MNIKQPVFIIGCQRSGTTFFMDVLSMNKEFAWVSNYVNKIPFLPMFSFVSKIYDLPLIGKKLRYSFRKKYFPRPVEPWNFFNSIDDNFFPKDRSSEIVQKQISIESKKDINKFRRKIANIMRFQMKNRFISKYTNKPRIRYLNSVFSDSFFIHVKRDGKGVVNSLYKQMIENNWFDYGEKENWIKAFPNDWKLDIERSSDSDILFLCYYYKYIVNLIEIQQNIIPKERIITIHYEDFLENPLQTLKDICIKINIRYDDDFKNFVKSNNYKNMNYKWKKDLNHKQKKILIDFFGGLPQ